MIANAPPPHRQGFIGDHRLQRGARALLGGGDGGISYRADGNPAEGSPARH
jgi:hypothetical protein